MEGLRLPLDLSLHAFLGHAVMGTLSSSPDLDAANDT